MSRQEDTQPVCEREVETRPVEQTMTDWGEFKAEMWKLQGKMDHIEMSSRENDP